MSRSPLRCRACGELLAYARPKRGTVTLLFPDRSRFEGHDLVLVCPRCGTERTVTRGLHTLTLHKAA